LRGVNTHATYALGEHVDVDAFVGHGAVAVAVGHALQVAPDPPAGERDVEVEIAEIASGTFGIARCDLVAMQEPGLDGRRTDEGLVDMLVVRVGPVHEHLTDAG